MDQLRLAIPDAPPVPTIHKMVLEFQTEDEAEFYRGISGIITRRWQALEEDRTAGAGLERLKLFMRLRQLSLHPQVYIQARKKMLRGLYARPDWLNTSTKFQKIGELIGSQQEQRRWIVFCHFRTEMELLEAALKKDLRIGRVQQYNGSLSHEEKRAVIQRTHEPLEGGGHEVLLVQLQSGGVGLNLQHFDRIIFTGPWWTEAMMVQAIGRAVRIGQREVVNVYHIVLKEEIALNIDAYMQEKAEAKGKLCKAVIAMATRTIAAA
jgi:SNF2 family DNA or RNA helicase